MPANAVTGRSYRGINVPILWASADSNGYPSHAWMTFKQALDHGAHVRKGERGAHVVFTKPLVFKGKRRFQATALSGSAFAQAHGRRSSIWLLRWPLTILASASAR